MWTNLHHSVRLVYRGMKTKKQNTAKEAALSYSASATSCESVWVVYGMHTQTWRSFHEFSIALFTTYIGQGFGFKQ